MTKSPSLPIISRGCLENKGTRARTEGLRLMMSRRKMR